MPVTHKMLEDDKAELRARIERLEAARKEVYDWMREPDYVENASLEWLTEWVNRRPISSAKEG